MYLEREKFSEINTMFSRATEYERAGDLQKAYALYFSVVDRLDRNDSTKAEKWTMIFPLFYPILSRMEEASDENGKGTRTIDAMYRAAFGHLLEKMGRSNDARAQYSIAAKSVGVDVERIRKMGKTVVNRK